MDSDPVVSIEDLEPGGRAELEELSVLFVEADVREPVSLTEVSAPDVVGSLLDTDLDPDAEDSADGSDDLEDLLILFVSEALTDVVPIEAVETPVVMGVTTFDAELLGKLALLDLLEGLFTAFVCCADCEELALWLVLKLKAD